jgi:hypothetical protein
MRNAILENLYQTRAVGEIESNLIKELKKAKESINYFEVHTKYLPFFWVESSIYTIRDRYTNVRNLIKETNIGKTKKALLLNSVFVLEDKFYETLNDESKKRETEKEDTKEFSIETYFSTFEEIKHSILNKDFKVLNGQTEKSVIANLSMFYLAFVTGRRFYEIVKTLNIIKKGGKIYFDGLAKKRDEDDEKQGLVLDEDYAFVRKALKYVRSYYAELVEDMDSKQINAKYSKNITRALKRTTKQDVSFHEIRERYAEVCEEKFNKGKIDVNIYKAIVLGHEIDTKSAEFYKSTKAKK